MGFCANLRLYFITQEFAKKSEKTGQGTLGCFIFSPFSNFKNPGVSVGGVSGKNSTPKILDLCDVIKMWFTGAEVFWAQFFNFNFEVF